MQGRKETKQTHKIQNDFEFTFFEIHTAVIAIAHSATYLLLRAALFIYILKQVPVSFSC